MRLLVHRITKKKVFWLQIEMDDPGFASLIGLASDQVIEGVHFQRSGCMSQSVKKMLEKLFRKVSVLGTVFVLQNSQVVPWCEFEIVPPESFWFIVSEPSQPNNITI